MSLSDSIDDNKSFTSYMSGLDYAACLFIAGWVIVSAVTLGSILRDQESFDTIKYYLGFPPHGNPAVSIVIPDVIDTPADMDEEEQAEIPQILSENARKLLVSSSAKILEKNKERDRARNERRIQESIAKLQMESSANLSDEIANGLILPDISAVEKPLVKSPDDAQILGDDGEHYLVSRDGSKVDLAGSVPIVYDQQERTVKKLNSGQTLHIHLKELGEFDNIKNDYPWLKEANAKITGKFVVVPSFDKKWTEGLNELYRDSRISTIAVAK